VTATVELNYETSGIAEKVHDVSTDWMLTTELVTTQPLVSQVIPQERLSVGLPLSKFSSSSK
jgi:hypothetical protein